MHKESCVKLKRTRDIVRLFGQNARVILKFSRIADHAYIGFY